MVRLGKYFRAPRRNATRQWLKVDLLFRFGERFYSSNTGISWSCETLAGTVAYLTEQGHTTAEIEKQLGRIRAERRRR
jgi:hypothetical protein